READVYVELPTGKLRAVHVKTALTDGNVTAIEGDPLKEGDDNRYNTRNPMGRVGRPSELANMAAFLMSEEVEYINGEVIAIDGAMGIMGNGTFSNMMAYSEADWQRIREQIQSTNAADKATRS
ncbi:MAG: SDR family oxidoreductase, partial [Reyranella sp.]|nr:SDR family oxidoreductase [Reyranella sp.]